MPKPKLSLLGQRFGHLTVIRARGSDGHHTLWEVRCDCGGVSVKVGAELRKKTRFCSHKCPLLVTRLRNERTTHSMSRHPVFAVWRSMLSRCGNPKHRAYKNYGGRGIGVCSRWMTFEVFWDDMRQGYKPGLTLDRVDNDAGYSKENCRWATHKTQARNRRNNVVIATPAGRMTAAEASDLFGIRRSTIFYRIRRGWPEHLLLIKPNPTNRIIS